MAVGPYGYLVSEQHHEGDGDAAGVSVQSFRTCRPGPRWGNYGEVFLAALLGLIGLHLALPGQQSAESHAAKSPDHRTPAV